MSLCLNCCCCLGIGYQATAILQTDTRSSSPIKLLHTHFQGNYRNSTVYVWFLGHIFKFVNKSRTYSIPLHLLCFFAEIQVVFETVQKVWYRYFFTQLICYQCLQNSNVAAISIRFFKNNN